MNTPNIIKIAYFDEQSTLDYVDIKNGGRSEHEKTTGNKEGASAGVSAKAGTGKILGFFSAGAEANATASVERAMKNKISNTILTDFLNMIGEDPVSVRVFEKLYLSILSGSTTEMKTIAPVMNAINGSLGFNEASNSMEIEISKMSAMLKELKGYTELLGSHNGYTCILRFNDNAFRNGYTLLDITEMALTFYAIKVGTTTKEKLSFDSIFLNKAKPSMNPFRAIEEVNSGQEGLSGDETLDVYDVMLAGIINSNEK